MGTRNHKATKDKQQFVAFSDDLSEVMALHYFLYEAVEGILNERSSSDQQTIGQLGLILFLRHLKERDQSLRQQLNKMQI